MDNGSIIPHSGSERHHLTTLRKPFRLLTFRWDHRRTGDVRIFHVFRPDCAERELHLGVEHSLPADYAQLPCSSSSDLSL